MNSRKRKARERRVKRAKAKRRGRRARPLTTVHRGMFIAEAKHLEVGSPEAEARDVILEELGDEKMRFMYENMQNPDIEVTFANEGEPGDGHIRLVEHDEWHSFED